MIDTLTISLALAGAILVGTIISLVIIAAVTKICYPPKDEEAMNKTESNERPSRLGKVGVNNSDDKVAFAEEYTTTDGAGPSDSNSQRTTETTDAVSSSPV